MTITFHGEPDEARELVDAVIRHCCCEFGVFGVRLSTCAAHRALAEDQEFLDRAVFYRRLRERLKAEEGIAA